MKSIEKREYIHSHLHQLDDNTVDEFYEKLRKTNVLKEKLISRAKKSEKDIESGNVLTREELERAITIGS